MERSLKRDVRALKKAHKLLEAKYERLLLISRQGVTSIVINGSDQHVILSADFLPVSIGDFMQAVLEGASSIRQEIRAIYKDEEEDARMEKRIAAFVSAAREAAMHGKPAIPFPLGK